MLFRHLAFRVLSYTNMRQVPQTANVPPHAQPPPPRASYHHHLPTIVFSDLDFNLRLISFMCASRFLFATFCFNKHTLCCLPPNLFSDSIFV